MSLSLTSSRLSFVALISVAFLASSKEEFHCCV